jgi:hypothetical protein
VDSNEAVAAVAAWAQATIPALTGAYDHVPVSKEMAMPDVVVEVQRSGVRRSGGDLFAAWDLQQALIYVVELELSFMVDNADTQAAAQQLRDFETATLLAVLADPTLGDRVPFASPLVEFDFTGPYVEYEDGTKGREMRMTLAVGDLVEATS